MAVAVGQYTISYLDDGTGVWTTTTAPTSPDYTFTISNLTGMPREPLVGDIIVYSYYRYTISSVGSTTVLAGTRESIKGEDGNGIDSISYFYKTTTSQNAPSASSITSTTIPTMSETDKYLWQKEVISFTDTSVQDKVTVSLIAIYGDSGTSGKGIQSITHYYLASPSNTGVTTDTPGWSTNVPVIDGNPGTLTATGEYFDLEHTLNNPLSDFKMYGHTQQDSTTGKNLINFKTINYNTLNNSTITRNGEEYTVTCDSSSKWGSCQFSQTNLQLEPNTTYTFSALVKSTTSTIGSSVFVYAGMINTNRNTSGNIVGAGERSYVTFTTPNTFGSNNKIGLVPQQINATTVFTDIMIEKSATMTDYEPYTNGASPNPDYPQEIKVVTGDNELKIDGKNYFTVANVAENTIHGIKIKVEDNVITLDGTNDYSASYSIQSWTSQSTRDYIDSLFKIGRTFTISSTNNSLAGIYIQYNYFKKGSTGQSALMTYYLTNQKSTFTIPQDYGHSASVFIGVLGTTTQVSGSFSIQLELGSEKTDFVPYQVPKKQLISLGVENLLPNDLETTTSNDVVITKNGDGTYTLNGTASADISLAICNDFIPMTGTWRMSGCPLGGSDTTYMLSAYVGYWGSGSPNIDTGSGTTITYTGNVKVRFYIKSGTQLNNLVFKPMITYATSGSFTPYGQKPIELCGDLSTAQDCIKRSTGTNIFSPTSAVLKQVGSFATTNILTATANSSVTIDSANCLHGTASAYVVLYIPFSFTKDRTVYNNGFVGSRSMQVYDSNGDVLLSTSSSTSYTPSSDFSGYLGIGINTGDSVEGKNVMFSYRSSTPVEPYGTGKWYVHKEIYKIILNGSENWGKTALFYANNLLSPIAMTNSECFSNYFMYSFNASENNSIYIANQGTAIWVNSNKFETASDFKTWLGTHNTEVRYILATPTNIEITNTTLINQLDNLLTLPLFKDVSHITITPYSLQPTMEIEYYTTPNKYLWSYQTTTFTDGTSSSTVPAVLSVAGSDGDTIFRSRTEPEDPYVGMMWFNTSTGALLMCSAIDSIDGPVWETQDLSIYATTSSVETSLNNKNKVFLEQPVPPYNPGDLWIVSDDNPLSPNYPNNGKICTCVQGKFLNESYSIDDWVVPLTAYTTLTEMTNVLGTDPSEWSSTSKSITTLINENTNKIEGTTSELSRLSVRASDIEMSFSKTGTMNFLGNSSGQNGLDDWTISNTSLASVVSASADDQTNDSIVSGSAFRLSTSSTFTMTSKLFTPPTSDIFTISLKARMTVPYSYINVTVHLYSDNNGVTEITPSADYPNTFNIPYAQDGEGTYILHHLTCSKDGQTARSARVVITSYPIKVVNTSTNPNATTGTTLKGKISNAGITYLYSGDNKYYYIMPYYQQLQVQTFTEDNLPTSASTESEYNDISTRVYHCVAENDIYYQNQPLLVKYLKGFYYTNRDDSLDFDFRAISDSYYITLLDSDSLNFFVLKPGTTITGSSTQPTHNAGYNYIGDIMVNGGQTVQTWTPRQDENLWGENIKFSSNGIKITNKDRGYGRILDSSSDIAFQLNIDGTIAAYIWQLTDTGFITKDIKCYGTFSMGTATATSSSLESTFSKVLEMKRSTSNDGVDDYIYS